MKMRRTIILAGVASVAVAVTALAAEPPKWLTLDWAYYNPVSLVLKEKGWLEEELEADGHRGALGAEPRLATRRSSS